MSSFQQPQETAASNLCAAGCGFFGSPATHGMCSVCYKKHLSTATATATDEPVARSAASVVNPGAAAGSSSAVAAKPAAVAAPATSVSLAVSSSPSTKKAEDPIRCPACYKKVGLMGFTCRCRKTFCGRHRHPEEHGCAFDFINIGRDAIARANPLIKADKLKVKI